MSTTIDQKVVEMRFDNGQFERGAAETISTLDKLKTSLNFDDVSNGIASLGNSVLSINSKLSPFGEVWRQLWSNVADVVWSAAGSVLSATQSMGIEQFFAGFQKYSLLTKAVQTIMSATRHEWADQAEQMDYVSAALEKLNWFTDETSYSFTDMVGNIGKFTAASIPMDTAVTSMMGIATWAGISGAGIYEASRAMYNLSQAIAMGYVSVKDWMSIENANMATKEFKQTVIDTAVELGYLKRDEDGFTYAIKQTKNGIEELEVSVDNFRTTLGDEYGYWFKADVLNSALDEYGGFVEKLYEHLGYLKTNATDMLDLLKDYKALLKDVQKTSEDIGIDDVEATKTLIQEYYKGTLNLEATAEEYGTTVDELSKHFDKYKGTLLDFNELKDMTDGTNYGAVALKRALDVLSAEEYELGYAALLASQESRTLEDAILGIQDAASSAWMRIFVTAMGDYLKATKLWADVYDEIWDLFVEDLNNFSYVVDEWGDLGGREVLIDALWNTWYSLKDILFAVKGAIQELFPELDGERLYNLTEAFRDFTETLGLNDLELLQLRTTVKYLWNIISNVWGNLSTVFGAIRDAFTEIFPKMKPVVQTIYEIARGGSKLSDSLRITEEQADKLKRTFKGVFAIFDIIGQFLGAVFTPIFERLGVGISDVSGGILDITSSFGDWLVELSEAIRETDFFGTAINAIVEFFDDLKNGINDTIYALTGLTSDELWGGTISLFGQAKDAIADFFSQFSSSDAENTETFSFNLSSVFQTLTGWINEIKAAWEEAKPYFDEMIEALGMSFEVDTMGWEDITEAFRKGGVLAALFLIAQILYDVYEYISWFVNYGPQAMMDFTRNIGLMGEAFSETMWNIQKRVKAGVISTIARSVLYLAIAIALIAAIKTDKLMVAANAIAGLLMELAGAMSILTKVTHGLEVAEVWVIGKALAAMGLAMLEVSVGLAILGRSFDTAEEIAAAASALGIMFGAMAAIMVVLSDLPTDSIAKLSGVSGAMAILGFALIEFSLALAIIIAVNEGNEVWNAVGALAVIMAAITTFFELMSSQGINAGKVTAASAALAIAGFALLELSVSLAIVMAFSKQAGDMVVAAGALGLLLLVIGVFFEMMSSQGINAGKITAAAGAMVIMGMALIEMAAAVAIISLAASNEGFAAGLAGLIGMLVVLAVVLTGMSKLANSGELVAASAALLIASMGLIALAYALSILSTIGSENIMDILFLMAASLTALVIAGMFAEKCVIGLIALGGALLMIGLGALAAGQGMMLFATGVNMLIAGGTAGVDVLIYFLEQLGGLLPNWFASLAAGITNFISTLLIDNAAVMLEAITNLIAVILQAAITCLPLFFDLVKMSITGMIETATVMLPVILGFVGYALEQFLLFIAGYTPMITATAIYILLDTLEQIANNIGKLVELLVRILLEVLLGTIDGITAEIPHIIESIWNFWITLIDSFADGLDEHSQELKDAIIHLCQSVISAVKTFFGINSPSTEFADIGTNLIQGLINGIGNMVEKAKEAISGLIDAFLGKALKMMGIETPEGESNTNVFLKIAGNLISGFIKGITDGVSEVVSTIGSFCTSVIEKAEHMFDEHSPSKVFARIGRYVDEGFAEGVDKYAGVAIQSTENMATGTIQAVSSAISSISDIFDGEMDGDPTIRPVLDLSDVVNGANAIDSMLNGNRAMYMAAYSSRDINSNIANRSNTAAAIDSLRATLSGFSSNGGMVNNNTFNITGDDPKSIAEEVSNILQRQVERTNAVWE